MIRTLFYALGGTVLALGLIFAPAPPALGQTITIGNATVEAFVIGNSQNVDGTWDGVELLRNPNNNTVNVISDGRVNRSVFGGGIESDIEINITASGNTVNVNNNGTVNGWGVYGGWAKNINEAFHISVTATRNTVTISGDSMVTVNASGDGAGVFGGFSDSHDGAATATHNTVNISGGTVNGSVIGGHAVNRRTNTATATHNTVNISGGTVSGNVIGGRAESAYTSITATATGNTVNIWGAPTLTNSILYGGFTEGRNAGDAFSRNTLNLFSPVTVRGVQNFEFLHFYLPNSVQAGDTMLSVTDTANIEGTKFDVGVQRGPNSLPLNVRDTVTLIDATDGDLVGAFEGTVNGRTMGGGIIYGYEFHVTTADKKVMAEVTRFVLDGSNKAYSEGFVSSVTLVTQGGDMIAGPGMSEAVDATQGAEAGVAPVLAGFGAVSGGSMRINSGSHVDMRSVSLVAGFAWGRDFDFGRPTLGAFFEYGTGSYDTYNSFAGSASVKGKGDTYYYGGGILGRMDFADTGPGRFYTEGSFRAGRIHNDYKRSDIGVSYDFSTPYYGFHLGAGYIWNINEQASLDLYGKYFWTRVQGETVHLSAGDSIKFKDADSSRLRLGGRFAYAINEHVSPYIGAAYEHEFDGKARATTAFGDPIPAPSLRGDTGIGELGLTLRPSLNLPLSFDLGVQGYTGKREGVTGSLQIRFTF